MSKRYFIKNGDGSSIITVADGSFFSDPNQNKTMSISDFYIEFYSDAEATVRVTPTAGTLSFYGQPFSGGNWLAAGANAAINAADCEAGISLYSPPAMDGLIDRSRVDMSGITGASYCRIIQYKR